MRPAYRSRYSISRIAVGAHERPRGRARPQRSVGVSTPWAPGLEGLARRRAWERASGWGACRGRGLARRGRDVPRYALGHQLEPQAAARLSPGAASPALQTRAPRETAAEVARVRAETPPLRQRVGELERLVGQLKRRLWPTA